jgi:protoporphyrinogen oxidase
LHAPASTAILEAGAPTVVVGAGPAGLTAALKLAERGEPVLVLEASGQLGGLARTVVEDGYRFDLGGHRFFTKSDQVRSLWQDLLGDELLVRPRRSRIRWRGRFVDYPLQAGDVIRKVGPAEVLLSGASYARARLRRRRQAEDFEQWVSDRFGRRLFEHFFRSYTEKVWGVPTSEIRADWAAQRIRKLSLGGAALAAIRGGDGGHHSLIDEFLYPRLGPGQLWDAMAERIERAGGEIRLDSPVESIGLGAGDGFSVGTPERTIETGAVISSMPLHTLAAIAEPVPAEVRSAAAGLRFRDFVTVALVIEGEAPFPDNWIYVHDPDVGVGRIQNFGAWSPDLVPEAGRCCLGLEYFCFAGDEVWQRADEELIDLAVRELRQIDLLAGAVVRGHVVRVERAYPIYGPDHPERIATIREWLDRVPGLQQIGRNGLHRYNNADHSMLTAIRAVENLCDGASHDLWAVNADAAYHEEHSSAPAQPYRRVPGPLSRPVTDEAHALQEIA